MCTDIYITCGENFCASPEYYRGMGGQKYGVVNSREERVK